MKLRGEGGSSRLQRQYIFNVPPLAGEYSGGSEVAKNMDVFPQNLLVAFVLSLLYVSGRAYRLDILKRNSEPNEGNVRLSGSESPSEGRVEIYHDGKWGTVCDDNWDMAEAQVVCRQLNFPGAKSVVIGKDYGKASGPIWLDEIACTGKEKQLVSCQFSGWGKTDCTHKEDAGVICESRNVTLSGSTHSLDHSIGLSGDLGQIFDSGTACDFLITFQTPNGNKTDDGTEEMIETTICAHKVILMLYPYFSASAGANNVTVTVSRPCQSYFTSFIRYLYTRKTEITHSSAMCLHQLASDFGINQLMEDIGRLFSNILPDDASFHSQVSLYKYAVESKDLVLEENCVQYMAWNFQNLTSSPVWPGLPVELLRSLLTRSDLVVADEYFLLQTLEDWINNNGGSLSSEKQTDLLRLIRFPMIPAEKLYELETKSLLFSAHRDLYRDSVLKAYQFNVLLYSNLTQLKLVKENNDYKPRIYTGETWSIAINPLANSLSSQSRNRYENYGYRDSYGRYGGYYPNPTASSNKQLSTPLHNSLLFKNNMITWEANILKTQNDCSWRGLRCESFPAARLALQNQYQSKSGVLFRNRLLLTCQSKYVCQIQGFKGDLAYVNTNDTQVLAYPCPDDKYTYTFVVRPEYV
ncbi:galectin-3-binding protein B isoform X2 [Xiphophorus couchianus]|uniref:galectin-3-binding protein B isoform X2 n=1 Tax=Xiphophorus couchianus TaxID=32473 RepID=UPI0010167E58|nr:galectin-3-binding protein B-like isoform X2 [Xiphophorus couchianus]